MDVDTGVGAVAVGADAGAGVVAGAVAGAVAGPLALANARSCSSDKSIQLSGASMTTVPAGFRWGQQAPHTVPRDL